VRRGLLSFALRAGCMGWQAALGGLLR
jgi:hypothetical protein